MVQLLDDPDFIHRIQSQFLTFLPTHSSSPSTCSLPYITLSWAQTLNGALCNDHGQPIEISSPASMTLTHLLRSQHDAILIGIGTVLADDPKLTVRLSETFTNGYQPQPVILDTYLKIPVEANLWSHPKLPWIFTECTNSFRIKTLQNLGAQVFILPELHDLDSVLYILSRHSIRSLMVEGGYTVLTSFLKAQCFDTCMITIAPMQVPTQRHLSTSFPPHVDVHWQHLGNDVILILQNKKSGMD